DGPTEPPYVAPPQGLQAQVQPPPPPPAPPVQTVRVEVAPIRFELPTLRVEIPLSAPAPAPPAAAPPPPPPPPAVEACDARGLPEFTVYFDFDKAIVKPEYLPKIKEFLGWLQTHPKCHIQVEGHTCRSGTYDYDAALGRRRAKAVYDELIGNGGDP